MAIKKITYNGSSKVIKRLCEVVNGLIDGGGGGSTVSYSQTLSSGTETGEITIDGVATKMYAPTPPTKVSDLQNDTGFITSTVSNLINYYTKTETYTKAEVDAAVAAVSTLNLLVVQTLPTQDISTTTIYLVPKQTAETQDVYDEYIYVDNAWERIGTTQIDLSNYYTKTQVDNLLSAKVSDNPTFTEASTRANIASGESFATILGKIKKWFTDLKDLAFIAKDGSTSKYLRGDGTWQTFPTIPAAQVNSDWNANSGVAQILNKPTIPSLDPIVHNNTDIPEGAANLSNTATAHRITAYRNGFSIPYQMDNTNDGGIVRVRGTSESNCIFELGTWDDSGAGETIQFNYYPTNSQVTPTYSVSVPKKSGTIALTSDLPTDFVSKDNGGTFAGTVEVQSSAYTPFKVKSKTNAECYIELSNNNGVLGSFGANTSGYPVFMTSGSAVYQLAYWSDIPTKVSELKNDSGYIKSNSDISGTAEYANYLKCSSDGGTGYVSNDTHIMQLGYFNRYSNYANATLLITSAFWGNQHGSADIININQDSNGGNTQDVWRVRISDKSNRTFYYKVVNDRVYLWAYVTGGNSYGRWNVTLLQSHNNSKSWVTEFKYNQSISGATTIPFAGQINEANHTVGEDCAYQGGYRRIKVTNDNGVYIYDNNGFGCRNRNDNGYTVCYASSYPGGSSRRFKENIHDLTEEEARKILEIETVTFDYKSDSGIVADEERYGKRGVIAEQVAPIIPSVVTYREENGENLIYGVDYSKFAPYFIKMIQLQQTEIDNLKAEISALKGDQP